jgi:hypothetical protein
MRRDILTGCVGLGVAMLLFICNQYRPPVKPIEYSPFLHKPEFSDIKGQNFNIRPALEDIHSTEPVIPEQKVMNSYTVPVTNTLGSISVEELMQLPLETDGGGWDEETAVSKQSIFIKYVRFQFTEVRDSERVCVGGFRFLNNGVPIPFEKMHLWNPHTGESKVYGGEAWCDSDQRSVIFYFSEPKQITEYELKSSYESEEHDPTQWSVEGSMNGSFWFTLDDRTQTPTAFPKVRNRIALYLMRP